MYKVELKYFLHPLEVDATSYRREQIALGPIGSNIEDVFVFYNSSLVDPNRNVVELMISQNKVSKITEIGVRYQA